MEDKKGLGPDNKSRSVSFIKPLNAPIGPKQTKCIVTETLDNYDLEKAVNLSVSTQNPDVPSGNIFIVKTKYCLSWAENNGTRVQVNCMVEWTGKSWLKGNVPAALPISPTHMANAKQYQSRRAPMTAKLNTVRTSSQA